MPTLIPALNYPPELLLQAQGIRVAFFDVDGVLTDGGLYFSEAGETLKRFNTLDGQGLKLLQQAGITPVVITGRDSPALRLRLKALGITHARFGTEDKRPAAEAFLQDLGLGWSQAAAMGDDWPDLPVMQRAAFACAPANGHAQAKALAHHVTAERGGEGAALASGMSPLGLGNDIGGSLRNPAHCNGIASIMPTKGVVPDAQMFPIEDFGLSSQLMLGQGVMARRIADVRAGLRVVAGAHARDPISVPVVLDEFPLAKKTRVAVMANPPGGTTHPGIESAVRKAADVLSNAGHEVVETMPPDFELACLLWSIQMNGELTMQLDLLNMVMGEGGRQFLELTREGMKEIDFAGWANAQTQRNGVARRWSLWFQENPVLICPTWTEPAFVYDNDIKDVESAMGTLQQLRAVLPANLLGLPAVVVPGGMADSLPVGVQVIGSRFTDLHCLAIAEQIESACGLSTPIDPID